MPLHAGCLIHSTHETMLKPENIPSFLYWDNQRKRPGIFNALIFHEGEKPSASQPYEQL